jgi:ATP synthase protein I
MKRDDPSRRVRLDPRAAIRRDSQRLARRDPDLRRFWRYLSVLGMVGWPIALGAVGGIWIGRWLDVRFDSGIRLTLSLMLVGVLIGCTVAWKTVTEKK